MKILYVEDEKYMALAIQQVLKKNKYDVELAHDGETGLDMALTGVYDIIILDIMLPKKDGITVLRELRMAGISAQVLLLTARGDTSDKVKGLDAGADDYLTKPFSSEELLARLRALYRRIVGEGVSSIAAVINFGDIELNYNRMDLICNGHTFHMMPKEARLLELLMRNHDTVVSAAAIVEKLWTWDSNADETHVQVQIAFIRKKLTAAKSNVKIKTIYSAGYMLIKD